MIRWVKGKIKMKIIKDILDWIWNMKALEGKRSRIAQGALLIFAAISAYQGAITSGELAEIGLYPPLIPGEVMTILSGLSAYFAGKMKKFVKEHKD